MRTLDDKRIAEKLNGLGNLPDGYRPDLQSKWDLLEAGLNHRKGKKRRLFAFWSAAAVFVFFLAGLWLFFRDSTSTIGPQTSMMRPAPVQHTPQVQAAATKTGTSTAVKKTTIRRTRPIRESIPAPVTATAEALIPESTPVNPVAATPEPLATGIPDPSVKKSRYIQIDFSDPQPEEKASLATDRSPQFRICFPGRKKNTPDDPSNRSLNWKRTF